MVRDAVDDMVRRAIGEDAAAIEWIGTHAATTRQPIVLVMAALLERDAALLRRALVLAATTRDRQVIAIAGAKLRQDREMVDALARDHLADHPDSYVVAWIASGAGDDG
jgi:hypothetical protein